MGAICACDQFKKEESFEVATGNGAISSPREKPITDQSNYNSRNRSMRREPTDKSLRSSKRSILIES